MQPYYEKLYTACNTKDFSFLDEITYDVGRVQAFTYLKNIVNKNKNLDIDSIFYLANTHKNKDERESFLKIFSPQYIFFQ